MVPTIIISVFLAIIVGLIIYRMICNARAGRGGCVSCNYAGTCAAAKILPKKPKRECPEQQEPVHQ